MLYQICLITMIYMHGLPCEELMSQCESRNKCNIGEDAFIPTCHCDDLCFLYNDCCKEHLQYHDTNNMTKLPVGRKETCHILTNDQISNAVRTGAFMVDRCNRGPALCNVTTVDLNTMVPVTCGNKTYVNAECADCNNQSECIFWSIALSVSEEMKMRVKTGNLSGDKELYADVINDSISVGHYYLHPPSYVTPRFCPYDVISREGTSGDTLNYLNIVSCGSTLYRNSEECFEQGCCHQESFQCFSYYLNFYVRRGDVRQTTTSFHVLMKFGKNYEKKKEEDNIGIGISYGGIDVNIILEMDHLVEISTTVHYCVLAIIESLKATTFRLVHVPYGYISWTTEEKTVMIELILQSTVDLSLEMVKRLSHFQQRIRCEDKRAPATFLFNTQTSFLTDFERSRSAKVYERHNKNELDGVKLLSNWATDSCNNLSITIKESSTPVAAAEILCLDTFIPLLTSQGHMFVTVNIKIIVCVVTIGIFIL